MSAAANGAWARVQHVKGAAAYAGYRNERQFLCAVNEGEMPAPFKIGGLDAWDIVELDASIEAVKAGAKRAYAWRERAPDRV